MENGQRDCNGGAGSSQCVQPGGNVRDEVWEKAGCAGGDTHNPSTKLISEIPLEKECNSVLPFHTAGPLGWDPFSLYQPGEGD